MKKATAKKVARKAARKAAPRAARTADTSSSADTTAASTEATAPTSSSTAAGGETTDAPTAEIEAQARELLEAAQRPKVLLTAPHLQLLAHGKEDRMSMTKALALASSGEGARTA